MSECRTCGAPVVFARTVSGGVPMPVDLQAAIDGSIELIDDPPGPTLARVVPVAERTGRTDLHLAHFVTCPDGEQWKRKRKPTRRNP